MTLIPPRWPHQTEAIQSADDRRTHAIVSATGTGKSRVIYEMAARELGLKRIPILINGSRPMMDQLHTGAMEFLGSKNVHFAYKRRTYAPGRLNIQSYGKLLSTYEELVERIPASEITIMVDEMHHAAYNMEQDKPSTRLAGILLRHAEAGGCIVGFTATLWRLSREEGFRPIFGSMWEAGSISKFIDDGILADYTTHLLPRGRRWREHVMMGQAITADDDGDLAKRLKSSRAVDSFGDYRILDTKEIQYPVSPELVVAEVERSTAEMGLGRVPQSLVYVPRISMALRVSEILRSMGYRVAMLCSDAGLARVARERGIPTDPVAVSRAFREKRINLIVNVGIVAEGVDFPAAECVIVGIATRSQVRWLQTIGRGLRRDGDKVCRIVDMTGNSIELGWPKEGLIEQSLDNRGDKGSENSWLKSCDQCGTQWGTAKQTCEKCGYHFGRVCLNCGVWHPWDYFNLDWMGSRLTMGSGWCDPCIRGEDEFRRGQHEMRARGLFPNFRTATREEVFRTMKVREGVRWLIEDHGDSELLMASLAGAKPLPIGHPCMALAPEDNKTYSGLVIASNQREVAIMVVAPNEIPKLSVMVKG